MSLQNTLANFWTHIKSVASGEAKSVRAFIEPLEQGIASAGESIVIGAVEKAVLASELTNGSGADKRNAAFEAITAELLTQGIKLAAPFVNGAIEAAVVKLESFKVKAA